MKAPITAYKCFAISPKAGLPFVFGVDYSSISIGMIVNDLNAKDSDYLFELIDSHNKILLVRTELITDVGQVVAHFKKTNKRELVEQPKKPPIVPPLAPTFTLSGLCGTEEKPHEFGPTYKGKDFKGNLQQYRYCTFCGNHEAIKQEEKKNEPVEKKKESDFEYFSRNLEESLSIWDWEWACYFALKLCQKDGLAETKKAFELVKGHINRFQFSMYIQKLSSRGLYSKVRRGFGEVK